MDRHCANLIAAEEIAYSGRYQDHKLDPAHLGGGPRLKIYWLIIGVVAIFAVLTPLMNTLMNWIRPLTPEQEESRRLAQEYRRRINLR
jgi:hypothetical protein